MALRNAWWLCCSIGMITWIGGCGSTPAADPNLGTADSGISGDAAIVVDAFAGHDAFVATPDSGGPSCAGCAIGGTCFTAGSRNPAQGCQICDPTRSATDWSANDGATCDDGAFCTVGDTCSAGTCHAGTARTCGDGVSCNGDETCDESANACVAGSSRCTSGALCDLATDACVSTATCAGCAIGDSCVASGARNSLNPCEVCRPASSRTAWSSDDGASCDDGSFCTVGDTCSASSCSGTPRTCADAVACNGIETCDESADLCVAGTSTCADGAVCDQASDRCVSTCTGCTIGGVCVPEGTPNPVNPCEVCAMARAADAWSANDGATCDDGAYCTVGDTCAARSCVGSARSCDDGVACDGVEVCDEVVDSCIPGVSTCDAPTFCEPATDSCVAHCDECSIGGTCFADGVRNPLNPCEICDISIAADSWSPNDGQTCDDGQFCTIDDTCSAGLCVGGGALDCSDGIACTGVETCDEDVDACVEGVRTCDEGFYCDIGTDSCRILCTGGCTIADACFAAGVRNALNPCEVCDPAANDMNWSPNDGASCDDGSFCTVSDVCTGSVCGAGTPRDCSDGIVCDGVETCDEAADDCVSPGSTCGPDGVCDVATDTCTYDCTGGCVIGGVCMADGTVNPLNPCEICVVFYDATGWSANDGSSCDDGLFCTVSDVCTGSVCTGGAPLDCSDGIACNGVETCDEGAAACAPGTSTCDAATETCDMATDTCVPVP